MRLRLALVVVALAFSANGQDLSECADDKTRMGVVGATLLVTEEALEAGYYGPQMVAFWRMHPLYVIELLT